MTTGECAFIGASSVVTKDVPAYALVYGVPGTIQGWVSKAGNIARCPEDASCYRLVDGRRVQTLEE